MNRVIKGVKLKFYNARRDPFCIYGLIIGNEGEPFRRIPYEVAEKTNFGVLRLHINTAGCGFDLRLIRLMWRFGW